MFALVLILITAGPARAISLDDFRYGAEVPAGDRTADFARCDERLDAWSSAEMFAEAEEALIAAKVYIERWRNAESGVDFALDTGDEAVALGSRMARITAAAILPPVTAELFDEAHQRLIWIQLYLGYSATTAELRALEAEIHADAYALPYDRPVARETQERLVHHIMLLVQQSHLARERGSSGFVIDPETLILLGQLLGHAPDEI